MKDEQTSFNKYQWSKFHGEGEQTVIRGNDWKEWCIDVDAAKGLINPQARTTEQKEYIENNSFQTSSQRMVEHMEANREAQGVCPHDAGWTKKVAGPTAKKPGAEYRKCTKCGAFMGYI